MSDQDTGSAIGQEYDFLRPWGAAGPAPVGQWATDILGDDFKAQTLALLPDEEGDAFATLVKYDPPEPPAPIRAQCLYLHGRNDYFFQKELAEQVAAAGVQFFALDLRKYGRSLRPGHTIGYAEDMTVYDEEIGIAVELLQNETPDLPLFLMGHSTGGLIATLWTYRHPGLVSGLILNSAWLELQAMAAWRPALHQIMSRIAQVNPRAVVISHRAPDLYGPSLTLGWEGSGLPLPDRLKDYSNDPAITGWAIHPEWKQTPSYPVPAAWLKAIMEAQETVEKELFLDCPVLSLCSKGSTTAAEWSPDVFSHDTVLDSEVIVERSAKLSDLVTIARLPGKHDLTLSDPDVRTRFYQILTAWLEANSQVTHGIR